MTPSTSGCFSNAFMSFTCSKLIRYIYIYIYIYMYIWNWGPLFSWGQFFFLHFSWSSKHKFNLTISLSVNEFKSSYLISSLLSLPLFSFFTIFDTTIISIIFLRLFDVLSNFIFVTSETMGDYHLWTWHIRVLSGVAERLKTWNMELLHA